jgi:hypothetical protein
MRLAEGPRPWPIRLFAVLFLIAGACTLASQLRNPGAVAAMLAHYSPALANRDGAIVAASARFTITLIPVALIWLLASPVVRWLVLIMALVRLAGLPDMVASTARSGFDPLAGVALAAVLAGAALLFTPSAAHWLHRKGERDASAFD